MNLIEVDRYNLYTKNNNKLLKIFLNNSKINKKKNKLKCFSGGGVFIINNKYIPLILRSKNAKSNHNKLSTGSGKPNSINEIFNPKFLIRELFEEISFIKNNSLVNFVNYKNVNFLNNKILKKKYLYLRSNYCKIKSDYTNINFSISQKLNLDELNIIQSNNKIKKIKCLIHIDNNYEVNILFVLKVNLNLDNNSLIIFDTEFHDKRKFVRPRNTFILEKNNNKYLFNGNFNKKYNFNLHSMTEHLKYVLNKIKYL